ncbi:MAG: hypothetical protein ACFE9Q_11360 [Candidatus Hodarchaeota archaeon]
MLAKKENLYKMVENIMFDNDNLTALRRAIDNVSLGTLSAKELRRKIVEFRAEALQKIVDLFHFYHKQITTKKDLKEFTDSPDNNQKLELDKKSKLLEEVGLRINAIYSKLKSKLENTI